MKVLFGFNDVLGLDAWLDYFEAKGFEVDGAMTGEDVLGTAHRFKPDVLVLEYKLKGELDGLGVYYELLGEPEMAEARMILIADFSDSELKKTNKKVVQSAGILGIIKPSKLSFGAVEELL